MPKRSQKEDRRMAMIGGSSELPKKDTQKKSSETVSKGKDFFNMSPASCLNIPLKDFSPEVRKMLVAGMVKGGKARVVKGKRPKRTKRVKIKKKNKCTYFCK